MKRLCYVLSTFLILTPFSTVLAKAPETPKIVFRSMRDGNFEIYSMNPDGSDQTNLTQHRANDYAPVWSPTGKQILFVSDRGGIPDLYLMDPNLERIELFRFPLTYVYKLRLQKGGTNACTREASSKEPLDV